MAGFRASGRCGNAFKAYAKPKDHAHGWFQATQIGRVYGNGQFLSSIEHTCVASPAGRSLR
jgi:hypothetical protein